MNFPASSKFMGASMHGEKMSVIYETLESGKHVLVVQEKTGTKGNKSIFEKRGTTEISLDKNESLSGYNGFVCFTDDELYAYSVVEKEKWKEHEEFHPVRAWAVNKSKLEITAVSDVKTVKCRWNPDGDAMFPK